MNNKKSVSAFFDNHEMIEEAVEKLHESGYDMKHNFTVPDYYLSSENVIVNHYLGDRLKRCCATAAIVAGTWGLLFGATLLCIL